MARAAMLPAMRTIIVLVLATLLSTACGGGSAAPSVKPVDCDTIARCERPFISVNGRSCSFYLTDDRCGGLYNTLIQCQYAGCQEGDAGFDFNASVTRCQAQFDAWYYCYPLHTPLDGGTVSDQ